MSGYLLRDASSRAAAIQAQVGISSTQYHRIKRRYLAGGLAEVLTERPCRRQPPKVTAALEAHITRPACCETPAGAGRCTLSLLNETCVSLDYMDTIFNESIRQVLKK